MPDLFATITTPKQGELIASPYRHGGSQAAATAYFIRGFTDVFAGLRQASDPDLPLVIIYAQKEQGKSGDERFSAGWEAILEAIIHADLAVTGTWPIRGTGSSRMIKSVGGGTSSLATYVALVCRPRESNARPTTRQEFMRALRADLAEGLPRLRHIGIPPVDLAQAAIGPGMGAFSRGGVVIEADGTPMVVREALKAINRVLDELQAEQEGEFDAATRFALTWFQQYRNVEADFGEADSLARAKNTSVASLVEAGVGFERAGRFRLYGFDDLDDSWDPARDKHLTVWEVEHHMARRLMTRGEPGAAEILVVAPVAAEAARELAYRLFTICEVKSWSREALQHNALVVAWPEIARLGKPGPSQEQLEV
jgi:putative DNA methylase